MPAEVEPTLGELAAKFADSDDDLDTSVEAEGVAPHGAQDASPAPPPAAAAAEGCPGPAEEDEGGYGEGGDDEEDEEEWDSDDDDELASALEWADLRDGE